MTKLRFSDGLEIDTSGDYRVIQEHDGYYVVGHGMLCAVPSYEAGVILMTKLQGPSHER
jgi:hypothetical protein